MSIKIEKVVTDRFTMRYFKFGEGERTAVILPGLSVKSVMYSADSIASAYGAMTEDYTVYVFDRRSICPEGYSIRDMADDTALAFDVLGLKDVYLLGVSQGGMIAQYIALDHPELLNRLVLCSTVARITEDNSGVLKEWISLAEQGNEALLNNSIINAVYSDGFVREYGGFIAKMMSGADAQDIERFIILAKSCDGFDVYDRLDGIKCPMLVIGSRADKVFDFRYIAGLAERAGAGMLVYEGYSHAVYDEAPDCINRIIKFFNEEM